MRATNSSFNLSFDDDVEVLMLYKELTAIYSKEQKSLGGSIKTILKAYPYTREFIFQLKRYLTIGEKL